MQQALLLLIVFGMAGCASIGPGTVTRDRFDYTLGGGGVVEEPDAPEPRQAALRRHPGVPGRRADHQRVHAGGHAVSRRDDLQYPRRCPRRPRQQRRAGGAGPLHRPADHHLRAAGGRALRARDDDAAAAAGHPEPHPGRVSRRRGVATRRARDQRYPQPLRRRPARAPGRPGVLRPVATTCVASRPLAASACACSGPTAARPSS